MALDKSPDMEGLTPAERAALYKQRAAAAGIGRGASPASAAAPAPAPAAPAPAPAAPPAAAATPAPAPAAPAAPAAAAAPAPAPKAPAPPPAPPQPKEPAIQEQQRRRVPETGKHARHGYAEVKIPRERLLDVANLLRDTGYDYLSFVTEVDWQDRFELLYHVYSYDYAKQAQGVVIRTDLPREDMPEIASVTPVWPGAELMERECFEMMGIRFLGHPDLRRILLADDFRGFPMRRDYETDFDYITVKRLVRELAPDDR
jgi:NADH-quinone oxidoreductase subunit C